MSGVSWWRRMGYRFRDQKRKAISQGSFAEGKKIKVDFVQLQTSVCLLDAGHLQAVAAKECQVKETAGTVLEQCFCPCEMVHTYTF